MTPSFVLRYLFVSSLGLGIIPASGDLKGYSTSKKVATCKKAAENYLKGNLCLQIYNVLYLPFNPSKSPLEASYIFVVCRLLFLLLAGFENSVLV